MEEKSKDPAFLFYPGDWMGGTLAFTRHQKGCYMDLLVAQFNIGPLSLETIKTVLGQDQAVWTVLSKKFKQDSEGNFFNKRLAAEMQKRAKFSARQSLNGSKGGRPKKPKNNPWVSSGLSNIENENVNEDVEEKGGAGGKETWDAFPGPECSLPLPENYIDMTVQLWFVNKRQNLSRADCLSFWDVFKVQSLTGMKFYANVADVYSHFLNWTKIQKIDHGNSKTSAGGKVNTSEARIAGLSNLK